MSVTDTSASIHNAATPMEMLCINTIRTLSMDAVQAANSGHPGTPMAMAPLAYCLWQEFLRYDPSDPLWPNRDRFVLSAGHASMLLYSVLHLAGVKEADKNSRNSEWSRRPARRHQEFPATRKPLPRPSGIASDDRRRDDDGAARPGLRKQRGDGARRTMARITI